MLREVLNVNTWSEQWANEVSWLICSGVILSVEIHGENLEVLRPLTKRMFDLWHIWCFLMAGICSV